MENTITELALWQRVNSTETLDELKSAILACANENGIIQGKARPFDANRMVGRVDDVAAGTQPINTLTRNYGIRQQFMYLSYYGEIK